MLCLVVCGGIIVMLVNGVPLRRILQRGPHFQVPTRSTLPPLILMGRYGGSLCHQFPTSILEPLLNLPLTFNTNLNLNFANNSCKSRLGNSIVRGR